MNPTTSWIDLDSLKESGPHRTELIETLREGIKGAEARGLQDAHVCLRCSRIHPGGREQGYPPSLIHTPVAGASPDALIGVLVSRLTDRAPGPGFYGRLLVTVTHPTMDGQALGGAAWERVIQIGGSEGGHPMGLPDPFAVLPGPGQGQPPYDPNNPYGNPYGGGGTYDPSQDIGSAHSEIALRWGRSVIGAAQRSVEERLGHERFHMAMNAELMEQNIRMAGKMLDMAHEFRMDALRIQGEIAGAARARAGTGGLGGIVERAAGAFGDRVTEKILALEGKGKPTEKRGEPTTTQTQERTTPNPDDYVTTPEGHEDDDFDPMEDEFDPSDGDGAGDDPGLLEGPSVSSETSGLPVKADPPPPPVKRGRGRPPKGAK